MHDRATAAYQTTSEALLEPGLGWPGLDLSHVRYEPSNQLLSMRLSSQKALEVETEKENI